MSKAKNPLFVVTNHGQDVEMAESWLDAVVKKFNLEPIVSFLNIILEMLLAQVSSFAMFQVLQTFLDELVETLDQVVKKVDPVLAFSIFKR